MREASTSARTEEIISQVRADNKPSAQVVLEVYFNGQWNVIDDLDTKSGITWTEGGKKEKWANFTLTPLPGTIKFDVHNENGKYSPGSGTAVEGVFDLDTKVRLKAGYLLADSTGTATDTLNLNDVSGLLVKSFFFRTYWNAGGSRIDVDQAQNETQQHFLDVLTDYDSINYDAGTYSIDAYTVQTYDSEGIGQEEITQFTVTANNTEGTVYYRTLNESTGLDASFLTNWTSAGATVNGTKTVSISTEDRFLQIAVVYDGLTDWDADLRVTQMTVTHSSNVEFLYKSVYYLDTPSFDDPKSPTQSKVFCSGRDVYKRALEQSVNLPDLNASPLDPGELIKYICDQINIQYDSDSIADLSSYGNITWADGLGDVKKADIIFEMILAKTLDNKYIMYTQYDDTLDDNILYYQQEPSLAVADGAFSYKNYINIANTKKDNSRLLNRCTVITDDQVPDPEVLLDSTAYTTTGNKTQSWSGDAQFKRIVIDKPDDITISGLSISNTQIQFTIDTITGTVTVKVYGNKWDSTAPTYEGEAIDLDNMVTGKGNTFKLVNPLMGSDAECKSTAEEVISNFGDPSFEAKGLTWSFINLLPEINDLYLLWRRFFSTSDLFFIIKATHQWNLAEKPRQLTSFDLSDSGLDANTPTWDDDVTKWDRGYVWDMGISTPLDTDAEIDAASDALTVYNIDFS